MSADTVLSLSKHARNKKRSISRRSSSVDNDRSRDEELAVVDVTDDLKKPLLPDKKSATSRKLDYSLFCTYLCCISVITLPITMIPSMAAEQAARLDDEDDDASLAGDSSRFVATVACVTTLGAAVGSGCNGFVCQWLGGKTSATLYLLVMGSLSLLLSTVESPTMTALLLGLLDFCGSIQWIAHSLLLTNYYKNDARRLSAGIAVLTAASTTGQVAAKVGGTALMEFFPSWRNVAQLGTLVSFVGVLLFLFVVPEPTKSVNQHVDTDGEKTKRPNTLIQSARHVLSSPLFWQAGLVDTTSCLARFSDKILGNFFKEATELPAYVCGGLTVCLTIGFLHGLSKVREFHRRPDAESKWDLIGRNYQMAVLSTLGIALFASPRVSALLKVSHVAIAGVVSCLGFLMASSLSFQVYQLPVMFASTFAEDYSVCLAFIHSFALLLAAPVYALMGQMVSLLDDDIGWSLALVLLAVLYMLGGMVMKNAFPSLMEQHAKATTAR